MRTLEIRSRETIVYIPASYREKGRFEMDISYRRTTGRASMQLFLAVFLIMGGLSYESAPAADVAEVVEQVSKESYTNYLQNDLYTHDGDERCFGPQHDLAQQRIRELFESFGLETSLHPFEYRETTCYNVVGVHRGISCPNEMYVLGAHYDSVEGSPGALDDGSGVAGLLESARVLSQHAFEGTIVFIAFDREEQGLKGSTAYANDHIGDHIHGMLNLEMIARLACGPEHPKHNQIWLAWITTQWGEPTRLLDDLTTAVESYTELTCMVRQDIGWGSGDVASFARVGFAAVQFESRGCSTQDFFHTAQDSVDQPDNIDYDNGTHLTQAVVACLATLAMLAPARIYPDFDEDGDVDIEDCVLLIEHWRGSDSQFDIAPPPNGDGVVNDQDLNALLHYWFSDRSSWFDFPQAQYSGGTGEPNDPYQIAKVEDLMLLGKRPYDYDKHFIMTADIDLDPNLPGRKVFDRAVIAPETTDARDPWGPPVFDGTPFAGVFEGNGHTISHLTISGASYLGLFGEICSGANISNLGLEAVDVNGRDHSIGGLVGSNGHLYGEGGILTNCYSTGSVSGDENVGGLVGGNDGTISICSTNANVFACGRYGYNVGGLIGGNSGSITTSYSTGTISICSSNANVFEYYGSNVGGLAGSNGGSISNSYSTGSVSGKSSVGGLVGRNYARIFTSYSTGSVSGDEDVGGLLGENKHGSIITSSFWDIETSGQATSEGGTGATTAEMHSVSTYLDSGWDFIDETENGVEDIWWIVESHDYPRLWWQYGKTHSHYPSRAARGVVRSPVLQWSSWAPDAGHDVYLGREEESVADATPNSAGMYRGRLPAEMTTYDPGILEYGVTYYWRIDEVDKTDPNCMWKGGVLSFTIVDAVTYLFPSNGASDIDPQTTLVWVPGGADLEYDLYFGQDEDTLANATPESVGVYLGRQLSETTTHELGDLDWEKTHYWRVDGIDQANLHGPWEGNVWSFTTADYAVVLVVDDFESYRDGVTMAGQAIWQAWIDGIGFTSPGPGHPGNDTGSFVGHDIDGPYNHIMEMQIVRGGAQSMPYYYYNDEEPYYSEAERTRETPQDWTIDNADTLTLYFRGEADNTPDPFYVAIEDSAGHIAVATHPDADVVLATEWQKWHIPLADLQADGVNVASVKKMIIGVGDRDNRQPSGTGLIYIDDILVTNRMP